MGMFGRLPHGAFCWPEVFPCSVGRRNAGADFSSASSGFKPLGAFFCNFPKIYNSATERSFLRLGIQLGLKRPRPPGDREGPEKLQKLHTLLVCFTEKMAHEGAPSCEATQPPF